MAAVDMREILQVKENASVLYSQEDIAAALDTMAMAISADAATENPIVLCIMNGGLVLTSELLSRLQFPLRLDYAHLSRYRDKTHGEELIWIRGPDTVLKDQAVLIVDDILDEGHTLSAVIEFCKEQQASKIRTAVLVSKDRPRDNPVAADYVGLVAPDRYLFGCGMDYKGYWRNSKVIYALSEIID